MPRQPSGWGNCVECGEELTPDDAEELGWSDRCRLCLAKNKVHEIINPRVHYIKKKIKEASSEQSKEYWEKRLDAYSKMGDLLREIKKLKAGIDYRASYPVGWVK